MNGPFAFGTVDAPEIFHQTAIQVSDTAIWTHGAHTIHFGFQAIRYRNNYVPATTSDGAAGQISFSGTYTGYSEADFFLGLAVLHGLRSRVIPELSASATRRWALSYRTTGASITS